MVRLDVYVTPSIRDSDDVSSHVVNVDESVELHCSVTGIPFPQIKWYKGKKPSKLYQHIYYADLQPKLTVNLESTQAIPAQWKARDFLSFVLGIFVFDGRNLILRFLGSFLNVQNYSQNPITCLFSVLKIFCGFRTSQLNVKYLQSSIKGCLMWCFALNVCRQQRKRKTDVDVRKLGVFVALQCTDGFSSKRFCVSLIQNP